MRALVPLLTSVLLLSGAIALGQEEPQPAQDGPKAPVPLTVSQRNANYDIDVTLDVEAKQLVGRTELHWRNLQQQPTDELWFHLYWNAWRNSRSTWMQENQIRRRRGREGPETEKDWGWIDVDTVRLVADGRPLERRFVSPDDGNPDDRTVMLVRLPAPVGPGEEVRVELTWRAKIPRTVARTGYRGQHFFFAHWFPKLGVYEEQGWNCHQFHASTEFFSDYGVYDVRMTVPRGWVLGATGREQERRDNDDGTTTHRYYQEDVHGFTWTTSPHYLEETREFKEPGLPPVQMRLLMQPERAGKADRHFAASAAALEHFGRWYGPYPYGHVTVVDPAYGADFGGMEYPTLFTCGTRLFSPPGSDSPESVTVHEMGHQFWYGLVGNNEFEHAWLDEGLNTFSTIRTLDEAYDPRILVRRYLRGFVPLRFHEIEIPRWARRVNRQRSRATWDVPDTPSYLYYPASGASISYDKTALWLMTLERHLGWDTLQTILSTFFERYRYRHPKPEDLFAIADEITGTDMSWFFDQVHYDSVAWDYGIQRVASARAAARGFVEQDGELIFVDRDDEDEEDEADDPQVEDGDEVVYRSEVVVRRWGGGRFPVDVRMVFEDGEEIRERWDGQAHWKLFVVERPAKIEYAEVDPDRVLMLDTLPSNNSRVRKPAGRLAATKWASKWMIWFQDYLATMAGFL